MVWGKLRPKFCTYDKVSNAALECQLRPKTLHMSILISLRALSTSRNKPLLKGHVLGLPFL